jgi:hypothetical protein
MEKKYCWDEDFIAKNLKKISSIKPRMENVKIIFDSLESYCHMQYIISKNPKEQIAFSEDFEINKHRYYDTFYKNMLRSQKRFSFPANDKSKAFITHISNLEYQKNCPLYPLFDNLENSIEQARNFYSYMGDHFHKGLIMAEELNKSLYHFSGNLTDYGLWFVDAYNGIPYILSSNDNTIMDIYSLTHEIGHTIDYIYNPYIVNRKQALDDVIPYLMEMCLTNFFREVNYHIEETLLASTTNYNEILIQAKNVRRQLELFELMHQDRLLDYEKLNQYTNNFYSEQLEQLFRSRYLDNLQSIYSFVIATELYSRYKSNPKAGLQDIKKILLRDEKQTINNLYNSIEIDVTSLSINEFEMNQKTLLLK